jgi:hypothetical protein
LFSSIPAFVVCEEDEGKVEEGGMQHWTALFHCKSVVCSVTGGISAGNRPGVCSEYNYCVEIIEVCYGIVGVLLFWDSRSISGFHCAVWWNLRHSMLENNFGWHRSVLNTHTTFERITRSSYHSCTNTIGTWYRWWKQPTSLRVCLSLFHGWCYGIFVQFASFVNELWYCNGAEMFETSLSVCRCNCRSTAWCYTVYFVRNIRSENTKIDHYFLTVSR